MNNYHNEENFSENPEQNLQIENELLKLKMQAERGAIFGGNMNDLPAEIEAEFLKNVQLFEDSFDKAKEITIYECIGRPEYKPADELKPEETKEEITRIIELLHSKNIILDVLGRYELSVIYKFITEELFQQKIREVNFPGYIHSFVYEDFHPNRHLGVEITAQTFLNHWFEEGFNDNTTEFANQIITAEGKIFSREEVISKLVNCLKSYRRFNNIKFKGSDTSVTWDDKEESGLGHAEGIFSYDAELESGEIMHIEGPFKLYMSNDDGYWRIVYFIFPGFTW